MVEPVRQSPYLLQIHGLPDLTWSSIHHLLSTSLLPQPVPLKTLHDPEKMKGPVNAPVGLIHQVYVPVQPGPAKIILRLLRHINTNGPSVLLLQLFIPFFIVVPVAAMEIQYVLGD